MHGASKVVIIIPLVILFLAVVLQLQQRVPFLNSKSKISPTPVLKPLSPTPPPVTSKVKIDLNGPYMCSYADKQQSAQVYIKNKNILIQMMQAHGENILINGDCYYKWEPNQFTGDKMCGVSTYLGLYETMSALGGVDIGSVLSIAHLSDDKGAALSSDFIENVVNSCKKQEVSDTVFAIPRTVSFKDTTPTGTQDQSGGLGGLGGLGNLFNLPFGK
jgi:hypothetical protein